MGLYLAPAQADAALIGESAYARAEAGLPSHGLCPVSAWVRGKKGMSPEHEGLAEVVCGHGAEEGEQIPPFSYVAGVGTAL